MRISLIAAMSENRVIGRENAIPWDVPADRRRFRELTMGHTLIMGRKTFESIGRPLPGRRSIVLTRQQGFRGEGCLVAHSLHQALRMAGDGAEVFICGGEEVYREAITFAERVCLTVIHGAYEGEVLFPPLPEAFAEIEREEVAGPVPCVFLTYLRRRREP